MIVERFTDFFFYKIKHNILPDYLRQCIPDEHEPTIYFPKARRKNNFSTRTKKFQYSFFPHCTNAWENLSTIITGSLSLNIFKSRYLEFFSVKPNSVYRIHNHIGLKYLTRLRVGLSHLKSHKFFHKFRDTPNKFCACDESSVESTEHYLLVCPNYHQFRHQLFTDLQTEMSIIPFNKSYLTQILLYGSESYSDGINNFILKCTIIYLINTKRFDGPLLA